MTSPEDAAGLKTRAESAVAAHVQTLGRDISEIQEHVASLERELTLAKDHLNRLEAAKAALEGRDVDQHSLRSARSKWSQAKRRGRPKTEVERLKREYEALKAKS